MESSSSQSVNSTSQWGNASRSGNAQTADPMAFFDMIMKTSQALSGKGEKSFDPVASTATAPHQTNESYTAPTDDPNLHDGYDESPSAYAPEVYPNEAADSQQTDEDAVDPEDVAAVAEFSSQTTSDEQAAGEPDQAALETSASAGQQEAILAAPDTLTGEETAEGLSDVENLAENKSLAEAQPFVDGNEAGTEQPLDTSVAAEEVVADAGSYAESGDVKSSKETQSNAEVFSEENSEPVVDETSESASPDDVPIAKSDERKAAEEVRAEQANATEQVAEVEADTEASSQHDSSRHDRRQENPRASQDANAKPNDTSLGNASNSSTQATVEAVSKATEALAAAAANASATASNSAGSANSSQPTGTHNIASLLQRGFQRGTLQKTTEGKPTTQLDPKQQIRLINRVARAVESTPPGQSIKIRLNPSELGQLKVEIKIENGNMLAKVEAENPATRQVLLDNLPQLRERLAEANIQVQQFEVELMGQQTTPDGSMSNLADQSNDQGSSRGSRGESGQGSHEDETTAKANESVNKEAERDSRNLNVTI